MCVRTVTDVVDAVEVLVTQVIVHVLTRSADYLQRVAGEEQRTVLTENNTEHTERRQTNALNTSHIWLYGRKEGNVLFNDALNTFYLQLYGVGHMLKDHSDSERGNPLPPHGLLFPISSKGSFICIIPQTRYHIPQPLLRQSWSTGWNEK